MAARQPFLIAEIGINHNGDVELAKKMIDTAADAGFDAVKFQKRTIETLAIGPVLNAQDERFPSHAAVDGLIAP